MRNALTLKYYENECIMHLQLEFMEKFLFLFFILNSIGLNTQIDSIRIDAGIYWQKKMNVSDALPS